MDKDSLPFVLLHALLRSHPDRELVNRIHTAFRESTFHSPYLNAAWHTIGAEKERSTKQ